MTLYILHVAAAIIVFFSGVFIYSRNFFKKANLAFFLFSLAISCWLFFSFVSYASLDVSEKLFWFKVSYFGIIFIPITFFHFISNFTRGKYDSALLLMSYVIGFIVFFILLFDRLIIGLHQYHWGFYPKVDPVFHVPFLIFFSSLFMVSLSRLVLKLFKKGAEISFLERARLKYLCIGGFLGIFGSIDFFPNYGISIYPMGFIFMVVLYCIFGYAFYKFYLLDIRVAVARAGIFGCVYALVLGAPFILGYKYDLWIQSIWMMLILATSGPFIFLFFQKRVEEELLKEDFRVQEFLVQASQGATTIHKISELNIFVKDTLGKMLQLNKIELYFLDRLGQYYEIFEEAEDHADDRRLFVDDAGVEYLKIQNAPIVYEEIRVRAADGRTSDKGLRVLCSIMGREGFQIIVPIHMSNIMTGFICLGDRRNNESYSNGLLNALLVLGNQIALAIENCRYIEAESLRMEEQGFQERVASLDMMAASFAHEIDNPMTVISGQIDFLQEILQDEAIVLAIPDQMRAAVLESLDHIMEASRRVSGMIEAILEYSRMGTGELKPVRISEVVESFLKIIVPQVKMSKINFKVDIQPDLSFVLGNKIQLEEVLINFAMNAMHAVNRNNEGDKKMCLKVFLRDDKTIRFEFFDNGYGIEESIIKNIFLASVTTKGSSEGTGLGLFRVRKIADAHRAQVWAESEGKGKGARMIFEIPVFEGDIQMVIKENAGRKRDAPRRMF